MNYLLPEHVKAQQAELLGAVLREVQGVLGKFLTGPTNNKIGFYKSNGDSLLLT